jgi:ketosteroid isomerase-like protein
MRDGHAFVVWEEALRYVRERDLDGFAGMFVQDGVVELPFPLPGLPRRADERQEIRRVLAPVWRAPHGTSRATSEPSTQSGPGRRYDALPLRDAEVIVVEFELHDVEPSGAPYRLSYVHVVTVGEGRTTLPRGYADARAVRDRLRTADLERNKEIVRRHFEGRARRLRQADPDASLTVDTLVAEGDMVSARSTLRRTRGGEKLVSSGMAFFRIERGEIAERWACYPGVGG